MARINSTKPADKELSKLQDSVRKRIVPASKLPKQFRACVYARSGQGKTRLASSAPSPLIVDINDEGTDSVRNDYDPDVFRVHFWNEINEIYWYLAAGDHPHKTVVIDGTTAMVNLCRKFVLGDEASRDASRDPDMMTRPLHGKVNELMGTQIINFRNLPMNVIFTALERKRTTGEDEDEDVEVFSAPDLPAGVLKTMTAAVGMIGFLNTTQIVTKVKQPEGGKKNVRVARTRLLIGPSDRYETKDRYGLMVPYIEAPNVTKILEQIYGKEAKK